MDRFGKRSTRALAGVIVVGVLALTGCGSDPITTGTRPHAGEAPAGATFDRTPIPLTQIPGYTPPGRTDDGRATRPLLGTSGEISWQVFNQDSIPLTDYSAPQPVSWGDPSDYTSIPGVLAWRGNNARTAPTYGQANLTEKKMSIAWTHNIGAVAAEGSYFPGAGWTGQPLLVNWPQATKAAMGLSAAQTADPSFTEVIYPVFDGHVYRLDLATGQETKPPMEGQWGFKGTGSIDPRGYPLLYAGQGLNQDGARSGPFEYRIFDLIQNKQVAHISGTDEVSGRKDPTGWGAFDSSALVDAHTDTLVEPGENGVIYQAKLNASFDPAAKTVSVDPSITKMTYRHPYAFQYGIESSTSAWKNLMYAGDNDGNLICWDATTLQIVWARQLSFGNDSDTTPTLGVENGRPYLYTGTSVAESGVQRQGQVAHLVKVDGLTGDVVWDHTVPTMFDFHVKGGVLATSLLGKGEVGDLVFYNVGRTTAPSEGTLLALDRVTGAVAWSRSLSKYSWSSPVLVSGTDGHQYGVFGDSDGVLHLFNPVDGRDYSTLSLGKNIEASVAVYNNMLVVASYNQKIYGIKLS